MNICFLARPAFEKYSIAVYTNIRKRYDKELGGFFITTNKKETEFVRNAVPEARIFETATFLRAHWTEYTVQDLVECETRYDCAPIWRYIYTDRFLINRNYEYAVKVSVGLFKFFEEIFSNNSIDIYLSETIATLQCYVAYLVGKKYGTKYYGQMSARGLDAIYHYVLNDPYQNISGFENNYLMKEYSEAEYQRANDFLTDFENREVKPSYMALNGQKPRLKLKYAILPLLRFVKGFDPEFNDPYSYMYYKANKAITNPISFYIRYQRCKKYYQKADYSRKYVYYPLHYQPEASTIVCAQKYEKQLFYIDSWAKSLPADTVLYVKEHYAVLGHRDPHFYVELKKYPNVVLIDPWESSRKLIQNCVAMTTLTGTAGWEAMLLRKPVFIGGNVYFDNAPCVVKVLDIYDNYLDNIKSWKQPPREDLLKYLCAYLRAIAPGNANYSRDEVRNSENMDLIVDSLMKHVLNH